MRSEFSRSIWLVVLIAIGLLIVGVVIFLAGDLLSGKDKSDPSEDAEKVIPGNDFATATMYVDPGEAQLFREALDKEGIKYTAWVSAKNDTGYTLYGTGWEKSDAEKVDRISLELYGDPCRSVGGESLSEIEPYKKLLDDAHIKYREFVAYKTHWVEWSKEDSDRANALGLGNDDEETCPESSNHSLKADVPGGPRP